VAASDIGLANVKRLLYDELQTSIVFFLAQFFGAGRASYGIAFTSGIIDAGLNNTL
jgi:hypothetical protein